MRDSTVSTIFASPIVRDHYSALSPLSDVCELCDMPSASHRSYRKCLHGYAECLHCSYHDMQSLHGCAEMPFNPIPTTGRCMEILGVS